MNLTAKIGLGVSSGAAFLMLESEVSAHACAVEQVVPANHAYAPCPIVLETIRKGSSVGSGANCECAIIIVYR